jgi:osmotically-inducible protein OsmY
MKLMMAVAMLALGACAGQKNERPPASAREPVSTTTTTSAALTVSDSVGAVDDSEAPIVAAKDTDRDLATRIRTSLRRDKALVNVPWQRVSMEVEDQHVTLRGRLPTVADSIEVERTVRATHGVRAVQNEIRTNDANQLQ